jgi:hypothetical protein
MDFVKKHYEKILLTVVLLGLVGALGFLPFLIAGDQQKVRDMTGVVLNTKVVPLPALDLTRQTNVMGRLRSPYKLDFSTTNKLFNPAQWQKTIDGRLIKVTAGNEVDLAVVTKITPLYLILTLDSIETNSIATNELSARYVISVERRARATGQAAALCILARKDRRFQDPGSEGFAGESGAIAANPATGGHRRAGDAVQGQTVPARGWLLRRLKIRS